MSASEHPTIELLAAFVQNAVTDQERAYIEQHLVNCRTCRETVAEFLRNQVPDIDS
jgi:hypothetical protein